MWSISKIFGYNGTIYYIFSLSLRMLAAFSLYPLVIYFTKNRFAAFVSTLLFATTYIGLEATNWVFNMNVYLAIALMNFSIYFLLISRINKNKKKILVSLLFFYLAHIIAPSRVTFFIFMIFTIDLVWGIKERKVNFFLKRQLLFLLVFIFARFAGNYGIGYFSGLIQKNFLLGMYDLEFLKKIFISVGSLIIPENFLPNRALGILGIAFFALLLALLYKYRFKKEGELILIALLFIITGLAAPIILWPHLPYFSPHRHLLLTAPGIALFGGSIVSLSHKKRFKLLVIICLVILMAIQVYSINKYLAHLEKTRSEITANIIWNQILQKIPNPMANPNPLVFYFESDSESAATLSDLVYFGFQVKIGVLFNIYSHKELPTPVNNFQNLREILKRGRYYGNNIYQYVPLTNIFAYRLEEKTKLKDITKETRAKLLTD